MKKILITSIFTLLPLVSVASNNTKDYEKLDQNIINFFEGRKADNQQTTLGSQQAQAERWGRVCKEKLAPELMEKLKLFNEADRLREIQTYDQDPNHRWSTKEKKIKEYLDECNLASSMSEKRSFLKQSMEDREASPVTSLDLRKIEDRLDQLEKNLILLSKALSENNSKNRKK